MLTVHADPISRAVAAVLDVDPCDVPRFVPLDGRGAWWPRLVAWLGDRALFAVAGPFDPHDPPAGRRIVIGRSALDDHRRDVIAVDGPTILVRSTFGGLLTSWPMHSLRFQVTR